MAWRNNRSAPQCEDTPDRVHSWHSGSLNYATCLSATGTPCRHSKQAQHVPYQQVFTVTHINTAQPHNAKHSHATGTNEFRNVACLPARAHTLQRSSMPEKTSAEYSPMSQETAGRNARPNANNQTEVWRGLRDLELHMYCNG